MRTPSTDIFGPVEENNDENIEDEEQEEDEEVEEEKEEEEPEEEETSSSEEEEEANDDNEPDPWHPLRQKVGEDIKATYLRFQVSTSSPRYMYPQPNRMSERANQTIKNLL